MLSFIREGDTIIVHSLDRLARNLDDLRKIVKDLIGRGVRIDERQTELFEFRAGERASNKGSQSLQLCNLVISIIQ